MENKPTVNEAPNQNSNSGKMVQEIKNDTKLIAYCGLYCGNCRKYLSGKCPSCQQLASPHWCKIRTCCMDKKISSCADCELARPNYCKKFNNPISKVFKLIFGSDREKSIIYIRTNGAESYATLMSETCRQSLKTKDRG